MEYPTISYEEIDAIVAGITVTHLPYWDHTRMRMALSFARFCHWQTVQRL